VNNKYYFFIINNKEINAEIKYFRKKIRNEKAFAFLDIDSIKLVALLSALLISNHLRSTGRKRSGRVGAHIEIERVNRATTPPRRLISGLEKTQTLRGNLHGIESLKSTLVERRAKKEGQKERVAREALILFSEILCSGIK